MESREGFRCLAENPLAFVGAGSAVRLDEAEGLRRKSVMRK